ncbi:hypothetical protein FMN50_05550 [Rhodobacterales bacterium]|nr:hypothetical protein FMN50_05550 [Rhodobacterales bacterium]
MRGRVSALVGALHPDGSMASGARSLVPDLNHRLHPELDERARQLPAMEKAISHRLQFLKSLIDPEAIADTVGAPAQQDGSHESMRPGSIQNSHWTTRSSPRRLRLCQTIPTKFF